MYPTPQPITNEAYHDCQITGVELAELQFRVRVAAPSANEHFIITVDRPAHLIVTDFLVGNVIDYVDCFTVDPENEAQMLREFGATGSQYFGEASVEAIQKSRSLIGQRFLAVRATYGARILAIGFDVTELRHGG